MGLFDWLFKRDKKKMLLPWSNKYSVDILELDAQHQKLFNIYNELVEAMYQGRSLEILKKTLDELIDYIVIHFMTEENYMQKYNYPGFAEHKEAHRRLRDRTMKIHREFTEGKPVLTAEVIDFLRNWLSEHVMNMDKKYVSHLKKMGAK